MRDALHSARVPSTAVEGLRHLVHADSPICTYQTLRLELIMASGTEFLESDCTGRSGNGHSVHSCAIFAEATFRTRCSIHARAPQETCSCTAVYERAGNSKVMAVDGDGTSNA